MMTETTTTEAAAEKPLDKITVKLTPDRALTRERDALLKPEVVTIATAEAYAAAIARVQALKAAEKRFAERFLEMRRPLREAADLNIATEREWLKPLRDEIAALMGGVTAWREAAEARDREARRVAREEAEAKAKAEREAQLAALEAARRNTASRVEKKALVDQKKALAAAPIVARSEAVAPSVPKVSGVYDRETWKAEVTDFETLIVAVAIPILVRRAENEIGAGSVQGQTSVFAEAALTWLKTFGYSPVATKYLLPNQEELDALATQCQADIPIPGVVGVRKVTTVVRGAAPVEEMI